VIYVLVSHICYRTYHVMSHVACYVARIMSRRTYHVASHVSCHVVETCALHSEFEKFFSLKKEAA
jgi:hypothetical protein